MSRRVWTTLLAANVAGWVATIGFAVWGIWNADDRGGVAFIFGLVATGGSMALAAWTDFHEVPKRKPRLPRQHRQRLREERARIDLEAEIRRMEQEAGL